MQRPFQTTRRHITLSAGLALVLFLGCGGTDRIVCGNAATPTNTGTSDGGSADGGGHITIKADAVLCQDITMSIVAPRAFQLGVATQISGSASNPAGDKFTIYWSASSGHFKDETEADTTFTCTDLGVQTITMLVANKDLCSDAVAQSVICVPPLDAGVDAGH
jgi:hypothetical protein